MNSSSEEIYPATDTSTAGAIWLDRAKSRFKATISSGLSKHPSHRFDGLGFDFSTPRP